MLGAKRGKMVIIFKEKIDQMIGVLLLTIYKKLSMGSFTS